MIQRNPPLELSAHYNAKVNIVEIRVKLGVLPAIGVGLTPNSFFEFCYKVANMFGPFIVALKKMVDEGKREDMKMEFDPAEWDKKMEDTDGNKRD